MAVLTIHHWRDKPKGLAEMRRVARGPLVFFGGHNLGAEDVLRLHEFTFSGGPPARPRADLPGGEYRRGARPGRDGTGTGTGRLRGRVRGGLLAAAGGTLLDPAIWRATSALSLIPAADRAAGMARLSADLASGRWHHRYGHLLTLNELDLGYCIVIATP